MTTVELQAPILPISADLEIHIRLRTQIHVTSFTAQRKVSKLMLDRVSNLLCGDAPTLVVADRLYWRVPVLLGFPTTGPVGKVSEIDVDVETGEVLFDQTLLDDIAAHTDDLARRTLPTAG